jgi:hypothetical protein
VNPVLLELDFQTLLATLPLVMSRRARMLKVCDFLEPLLAGSDKQFVTGYLPEIVQLIQRDLPHCGVEGTSEQFYLRIERLLIAIRSEAASLLDGESWERLVTQCASYRARAHTLGMRPVQTPRKKARRRLTKKPIAPRVPVVETEPLVPVLSGHFASVCPLVIEASRKQKKEKADSVYLELYADPDGAQKAMMDIASKAARALYEKSWDKRFPYTLNIHCSFGQQGTIIGGSSGLAAAAAIYCELVRLDESTYISFLPGVALTGTVDEAGNVSAVDPEALEKKLEACLYASIQCVVVPKEQLGAAEAILAERARQDGVRAPDLIGVSQLEEVFYDRRITYISVSTMPVRLLKRAWRYRRPLAILLLLVLAGIIVKMAILRRDDNPVFGEFQDESLIIKNQYGHVLDRQVVGSGIVSWAADPNDKAGRMYQLRSFYDVDGDGTNEVFYVTRDKESGVSDKIVCRSISGHRLLWEKALNPPLNFPKNSDPVGKNFRIIGFYVFPINGTQEPKVFVYGNDIYFPSTIVRLDARSGNIEQTYIHVGQIGDVVVVDLDGDRLPELVGCATNNAFQSAAIFSLEPQDISGWSPTNGEYIPDNYTLAHHKEYVLIPRTITGEALKHLYRRNGAISIDTDTSSKQLSVACNDLGINVEIGEEPPRTRVVLNADIHVRFDYHLQPVSAGTSNNYDLAIDELLRRGWIKNKPDRAYFSTYIKTFPRWNGHEFIPPPKSYR